MERLIQFAQAHSLLEVNAERVYGHQVYFLLFRFPRRVDFGNNWSG